MSFGAMKIRIAMLEENENDIDFPENVMERKPWTFSYLDELYERSVNGARSTRAIKHIKRVMITLYGLKGLSIIACILLIVLVLWLLMHR